MPAAVQFPRPPLLSPRQAQLLATIEQLQRERGYPPTAREVAAAMAVHPSRIAQLAATAAAKGRLQLGPPRTARAWRVLPPTDRKPHKPSRR